MFAAIERAASTCVAMLTSRAAPQVIETAGLQTPYEEEQARQRREILSRRASYRKILNDLGGGEISEDKADGDSDSAPPFQGNGIIKGARNQCCVGRGCRHRARLRDSVSAWRDPCAFVK